MVVYADVVFFINFVSSYILLYLLGRIVNVMRPKQLRLMIASAIGGAAAALIFCTSLRRWELLAIRAAAALIMVFVSFFTTKKSVIRQLVWFFIMSGIMISAMVFLLSVIKGRTGMMLKDGIMYFDLPPKIFLLSFALSYLILIFCLRVFKNRENKKYYIMSVTHNDKTITVSALFDSGNLLKEPVTGKYVSILEWEEAKKLFDATFPFDEITDHLEDMKLWVIPYTTLGGGKTMFAFLADDVSLPEEKKDIGRSFIGIYGSSLSKNKEYSALLNAGLI